MVSEQTTGNENTNMVSETILQSLCFLISIHDRMKFQVLKREEEGMEHIYNNLGQHSTCS